MHPSQDAFLFEMAKKKVKHRRPQVRFSRETVSAARVTSGHCSTLWVSEQNLRECTRIPRARNSRGITQDSKRRGQKRVQGTTTLACQCGQRRRHRCGTHPSHRVSPSQFLLSSWTRFAFLRSLSWLLRCIAPHSPSCFVDLFAMQALWKVRISVVWFHLQQFFVQAHASMPVDLPAFNILHSCHKTAAVTGDFNLFPNRSPLLPSGREIPSFITRARRPCCLHADMLKSLPLMSTSF